MTSKKKILIISFSSLHSDPRVLRQIRVLSGHGYIYAAGYTDPCASSAFRDVNVKWVPLKKEEMTLKTKIKKVLQLKLRLLKKYYNEQLPVSILYNLKLDDFDLIVANDVETLPIALILAKGKPVYLDAHEYAPMEHSNFLWKFLFTDYTLWLCKNYLNQASAMTTVGYEIAKEYQKKFNIALPQVIPNASEYKSLNVTPVEDKIHLVHHGGVHKGRGLDELIRLMNLLDERFILNFYLVANSSVSQKYLSSLKQTASHLKYKIYFHEPVEMSTIPQVINQYDIGVYLLQPVSFNNEMALPNKFFEFVQARLAIATGPSREMAKIVSEYDLGVVSEDFSAHSMAEKLNSLSKKKIMKMKNNSHKAAFDLSFDAYSKKLLDIVDCLLES